jgi:hypothetical protein
MKCDEIDCQQKQRKPASSSRLMCMWKCHRFVGVGACASFIVYRG